MHPFTIILIAFGLAYVAINISEKDDLIHNKMNGCLTLIAEKYCNEVDMFYLDGRTYRNYFYCFETNRSPSGEKFLFLKNEIKDCKLFALGEQDE